MTSSNSQGSADPSQGSADPSQATADPSQDTQELSMESGKGPLFSADAESDGSEGSPSPYDDDEDVERPRFWQLNLGAAYLHAAQSVIILVLYFARKTSSGARYDLVYPLSKSYSLWEGAPPFQGTPMANPGCVTPISVQFGNQQVSLQRIDAGQQLSLTWLIFGFFALSALFQGAAPFLENLGVYPYTRFVQEDGIHPLRFVEYSISASIMLVAIALQTGITDTDLLWSIGVLTGTCMLFGLLAELCLAYVRPDEYRVRCAWIAHVSGYPPVLAAYGIILRFFADSQNTCDGGGAAPTFVYVIVILQFVLFMGFGVTQFVQIAFVDRIKKESIETAYIVQSLVSKTLLCWIIYGSVFVQS